MSVDQLPGPKQNQHLSKLNSQNKGVMPIWISLHHYLDSLINCSLVQNKKCKQIQFSNQFAFLHKSTKMKYHAPSLGVLIVVCNKDWKVHNYYLAINMPLRNMGGVV
jgi:hypothetical protein